MHSARLEALGASAELVAALQQSTPLIDPELAAIRRFTIAVVANLGGGRRHHPAGISSARIHGANALEVVLGIGAYTMSTLANRMTGADRPALDGTPAMLIPRAAA